MTKNIIVNEQDEVIDYKDTADITNRDLFRVSALWIINSRGEILLAKRALNKIWSPGKWGPAVGGTVEKDETYESNIIKEAKEEIGLTNISPIKIDKVRSQNPKYPHFIQRFVLRLDRDVREFTLQEQEVAEIKWFSPEELTAALTKNPEMFLSSVQSWKEVINQLPPLQN